PRAARRSGKNSCAEISASGKFFVTIFVSCASTQSGLSLVSSRGNRRSVMNRFLGSLASYRLPLLVPALFEGPHLSGSLRVRRAGTRRAFGIEGGKLTFESSTDPREHLAQLLVDSGVLDLWSAVNAYDDARREGAP